MVDISEFTQGINIRDFVPNITSSEIFKGLWDNAPPDLKQKMSLFFTVSTSFFVVLIVYFLIKIIQQFLRFRDSKNIARIAETVTEINEKLSKGKSHTGKKKED